MERGSIDELQRHLELEQPFVKKKITPTLPTKTEWRAILTHNIPK